MNTATLTTKKMGAFREILNIDNENIIAYVRELKKSATKQVSTSPPEGFMTGDEFERRVKEELKQLYKEHGLL